jgi:hypothetical protein
MADDYQEQFDLIEAYFVNAKNVTRALQWYAEQYPNRQIPSRFVLQRMVKNLKRHGRLESRLRRLQQPIGYSDFDLSVLTYFEAYPKASSREAAEILGSNHTRVLSVLKKYKYKCYREGRLVQKLLPGDTDRRLQFCRDIEAKLAQDENFLDYIIWSDESNFSNNGMYNRHNNHYWCRINPMRTHETNNQVRFSFNVWCGIMKNRVVMVHIFEGHLNTVKYLEILELLRNALNDLPEEYDTFIFQQDGAPAHNSRLSTTYLNNHFQTWIGTKGIIKWPARSPDLTPLDYFLWGYVKDVIYKRTYENVRELKTEVHAAITNIHHNSLQRATKRQFLKRLDLCKRQNGAHFEQLL